MRIRDVWITAVLLITACDTSGQLDATPLATFILPPTFTVEPTPAATSSPPATETTAPSATTQPNLPFDPPPVDLPAGLLIAEQGAQGGLWQLQDSGELRRIATNVAYFALSPDNTSVLYGSEDRDIWQIDLQTGDQRNVTNTPDRWESDPQWWGDRTDGFLCASMTPAQAGSYLGYLTYVGFDGSVRVLDEEIIIGSHAPSPDGQTIAYTYTGSVEPDEPSNLWLFREGEGSQQVDVGVFGLEANYIAGVDWSPDGTMLSATTIWVGANRDYPFSDVVVLDLVAQTSQVLHSYIPGCGGCAIASVPVWSPAGDWQTFWIFVQDNAEPAIWLADANGARPISDDTPDQNSIRWLTRPTISPDGEWIAVTTSQGIGLIRVADGAIYHWPKRGQAIGAYYLEWATPP